MDHLDAQFLAITGAYKKRSEPNASGLKVLDLSSYISALRSLLLLIIQIPPVPPSASLRVNFLLRLTNDFLTSVTGYPVPHDEHLTELLDWLDDLDEAWVVIIQCQIWDPESGHGLDLILPSNVSMPSSPLTQTDRTRLRSLLIGGTASIEEWLTSIPEDANHGDRAQQLDDLFVTTLEEIGGFSGLLNEVQGMEGTC